MIAWNTAGLVLNLIGVLLLFQFGMPTRVRTGGVKVLAVDGAEDQKTIRIERCYTALGFVGIAAICIGTLCQAWSQFVPPQP